MQVKHVVFCEGCGCYTFFYQWCPATSQTDETRVVPQVYLPWRIIQPWRGCAVAVCSDDCERDALSRRRLLVKEQASG